jgi:hypothetical protein
MLRNVKNAALLFALLMLSLAGAGFAQGPPASTADPVSAGPATLAIQPNGVNIDVRFTNDLICGFQIIVHGKKPTNFYLGTQNPWGNPTVVETPPGSSIWVITWGSPQNGPCFPRSSSIFWNNGVFVGAHFGFYTDEPLSEILGSGMNWVFGLNTSFPGPPLTGHSVHGWNVAVANANDVALSVRNVQVAVAAAEIPINDLARHSLGGLSWQPVRLADDYLPAGSNEAPGILSFDLPSSVQGQKGWGVVTYDVVDPANPKSYSTVTFEFLLP